MSYRRPLLIAFVALVLALAGSPVDAHGDHRHGDPTPFDVRGGLLHADRVPGVRHDDRAGAAAEFATRLEMAPAAETQRAPRESPIVAAPAQCPDHDGRPCCCGADRCTGSPDPRPIIDALAAASVPAAPPVQRATSAGDGTTVAHRHVYGPLGARAPPPAH